ncbi:hypothetical protein P106B_44 [Rhizobium phage vB_RglS_P106B]|uniref:Uncharacterized protein n=1 Tax=Rhizobium phage vB_RglS_P106B TaxID=1458697 RepID=W6EC22_9CAUD|nr:hypothetical protein P106B_44 [Rhizobium phage vB_RglS_P106B]AHJ10727.1 hypothetical protein P106B_44 [Rhizobium phage vB_RglS_P106B]
MNANIEEILKNRRNELNGEIEQLEQERNKIDTALSIIINGNKPEEGMTKETAIIEAVKHGSRKPNTIHRYIQQHMRMNMNIGSLRSTLSRLKSEGKISHNEHGWTM